MAATVLHVTTLLGGGVDRHLRDIARAVPGRHLFWHAGDTADVLEYPGEARFAALDPQKIAAEPHALADALRGEGVGLVHLHSTARPARERALGIAAALGVRHVATLHDVLFLRPDGFDAPPDASPDAAWLAANAAMLRAASAVLAPSRFIAETARGHVEGLAVEVVPNGSPDRSGPGRVLPRREFQSRCPGHVVAVLGAIGPHKGSELLEALPALLEGSDIGVVVIGYLDRQLHPGWRVPGQLFIHGAYDDDEVAGLLHGYGAELALFPNRVAESFSYALSDVWAAEVPVLAAPLGALAERIGAHGGGWLLPAGFDARAVAAELRRLLGAGGAAELARVKSSLSRPDPARIPTLDAMARSLDAFYRRFAIDPATPGAASSAALQRLLAANVDGSVFRQELVRLADEYAQVKAALEGERARTEKFETESREWMAKLERDVAALTEELQREVLERRRLGEANFQLQLHKEALDRLPEVVRRILLKKTLHARS